MSIFAWGARGSRGKVSGQVWSPCHASGKRQAGPVADTAAHASSLQACWLCGTAMRMFKLYQETLLTEGRAVHPPPARRRCCCWPASAASRARQLCPGVTGICNQMCRVLCVDDVCRRSRSMWQ